MRHVTIGGAAACTLLLALTIAPHLGAASAGKIPITTSSEEARQLYLKGRDLAEKLRATDARKLYEQAAQKDPTFAMAYVGLANTSGTTKEFIEATTKAVSLAGNASEGERHIVQALEAGMKNDPSGVLEHYTELVRLFPDDERAQTLLGNTYFGRQEYTAAIAHFVKATSINPSFSQPYNQLGYAYRFLEKYDEAERTFKKYTELLPDDPNPYDSYAELLMKRGRFDESIASYKKALSIDPNFVASYVGIGNDYLFMAKGDEARAAFSKIEAVARNTGEKRLAHFWKAASYVHEGATDQAIAELKAEYALAEAEHDGASMSGDLNQMGDVLREAGRIDDASKMYAESLSAIDKADVPQSVKDATHRNDLFEQGRVALARNDVATAKAKLLEYTSQNASRKAPFALKQQHELAGMIALAEKRGSVAMQELKQANWQDPRVIYLASMAARQSGDTQTAVALAGKAAKYNGLAFNYGYVRSKALKEVVGTGAAQ